MPRTRKQSSPKKPKASVATEPVPTLPELAEPEREEEEETAKVEPEPEPEPKKIAPEPIDLCDSEDEQSVSHSTLVVPVPTICLPEYLRPFCWDQVEGTLFSRNRAEFRGMYDQFVDRVLMQLQRKSNAWQAEHKDMSLCQQHFRVFELLKERYYSPVFLDDPSPNLITPTASDEEREEEEKEEASSNQVRRYRSTLKVHYESARQAKEDGKAKAPTLTLNLLIEPPLPLEEWVRGRLRQEYLDRKATFATTAAMETAFAAHLSAVQHMTDAFLAPSTKNSESLAKRNCFRGTHLSDRRQITLPTHLTLSNVVEWQQALINGFNALGYAQLPVESESWYSGLFRTVSPETSAPKKKRKRTPSSSPTTTTTVTQKRRRARQLSDSPVLVVDECSPQQLIEARLRPKLEAWLNDVLRIDSAVPFHQLASRYLDERPAEFHEAFPFITCEWLIRCFRSILDSKLASLATLLD